MTDRILGQFPDQIYESEKQAWLEGLWWRKKGILDSKSELDDRMSLINSLTAVEVDIEKRYPDLPPEEGPVVVQEVINCGSVCPTQWEGTTADGLEVYARYRWGCLNVWVDGEIVFSKRLDEDPDYTDDELKEHYKGLSEDVIESMISSYRTVKEFSGGSVSYDGHLEYEELVEATEGWFVWPT